MRKQLVALLFAAVLLGAGTASAQSTVFDLQPGVDQSASVFGGSCNFPDNRICFFDFTATGVTPLMWVSMCENYTATFTSDITDNSLFLNIGQLFDLSADTIDAGDDAARLVSTMDGNPAGSDDVVKGDDGYALYFRLTTFSANTARIRLHCHPRAN